ncbi:MAG: hypothetical protein LBC76_08310 [Treponema sp.]|nr:hypothetical protein [Treponema sp.]
MSEVKQLGIYIPSYRRAKTAVTHKHLEYYQYVVRKTEEDDYKSAGIQNILAVNDELICGAVEVNQWLIDNAPEPIICILDDDIPQFYYRLTRNDAITDPILITSEIERIAQLMLDIEIGYATVDPTITLWNYSAEFTFKGTSGAVRWINRSVFKAKCNKDIECNWDLDVVLQELLVNRIILKPMYFTNNALTDTNEGGFSAKDRHDQIVSINLMKAKWGKYFSYNLKNNKPNINVER